MLSVGKIGHLTGGGRGSILTSVFFLSISFEFGTVWVLKRKSIRATEGKKTTKNGSSMQVVCSS